MKWWWVEGGGWISFLAIHNSTYAFSFWYFFTMMMYRRMAAAIEIYVYKHFFCHSIFFCKKKECEKQEDEEGIGIFAIWKPPSFPLLYIYPVIQFSALHIIHFECEWETM